MIIVVDFSQKLKNKKIIVYNTNKSISIAYITYAGMISEFWNTERTIICLGK